DRGDAPNDRPRLAATLTDYVRGAVPLRVVAVHPTPEDRSRFRDLLVRPGDRLLRPAAGAAGIHSSSKHKRFPVWLAAGVLAVLLLLGLNEQACRPLAWGRERGS